MPEYNYPPRVTPPQIVIRPVQPPPPPPQPTPEEVMEPEEQGEEQEVTHQTADDGVSDLFETGVDDQAEDIDDLFEVTDEDIMGDEDGDMSDLFEVTHDDIVGRSRPRVRRPLPRRQIPGDGGMQGIGR